jgi:anti-sigma regulatory factor (Ser/Thr protein kinase)
LLVAAPCETGGYRLATLCAQWDARYDDRILIMAVAESSTVEGYRHEAFFYAGSDDFMRGVVGFIQDAVASDEPILVVIGAAKIADVRHELNGDASRVSFADMGEIGTNPARIIPAWHQFLQENQAPGRRLRGIGEPIWPGRDPDELDECERHEALLNIAFDEPEFWLLCPYDTLGLEPAVIEKARRNHRFVRENGVSRTSGDFPGAEVLAAPFEKPLPDPPWHAARLEFDARDLSRVRSFVMGRAGAFGLSDDRAEQLVLAVNEVATNSLVHGGGNGSLRLWRGPESVMCEVRDRGHITDQLVGRERPAVLHEGHRGLWLANQLCELVQIRSTATGTTVRLRVRRR